MSLITAIVIFCVLIAATFLSLWLYYDHRDYSIFERQRRKTTFHCIKCDQLYIVRGIVDEAECPHCHRMNTRLTF